MQQSSNKQSEDPKVVRAREGFQHLLETGAIPDYRDGLARLSFDNCLPNVLDIIYDFQVVDTGCSIDDNGSLVIVFDCVNAHPIEHSQEFFEDTIAQINERLAEDGFSDVTVIDLDLELVRKRLYPSFREVCQVAMNNREPDMEL